MYSSIKRSKTDNNEDRRWGIYQEQREQTVRSFCFMSLTGKILESCGFSKQKHVFKVEKYLKVAFTENFVDILKLLQVVSKLSNKTVFV